MRRFLAILLVLANTPFLAAQEKVLDHGRVLACALDVFPHKLKDTTNLADTKNYVFRGKVISLGKDKKVSICYDVEHMRVAGAWVGKPNAVEKMQVMPNFALQYRIKAADGAAVSGELNGTVHRVP